MPSRSIHAGEPPGGVLGESPSDTVHSQQVLDPQGTRGHGIYCVTKSLHLRGPRSSSGNTGKQH